MTNSLVTEVDADMDTEPATKTQTKTEPSTELAPAEPAPKPRLVLLPTDDDAGVCYPNGECYP
jgi:hypothetical protein